MESVETRESVRAAFRAQGFVRIGFTSSDPVEDQVTPWVTRGLHAGMAYMAIRPSERADPGKLLEGARSVICVAAAYPGTDARGAIAGYARGEDYHRTMKRSLRAAVDEIAPLLPGAKTRICVDTAPLRERGFAVRAGLGWIGRNTMLLDEEHGPWMLLGEVLVDREFPPDEPGADRCGTCTACVDACPTGALDDPRTLDSRLCLSYWTIEHRGELPGDMARAAGGRVFGCDDCLTACPFPRRKPSLPNPSPFEPRADLVAPSLDDLDSRATESFRRHFASTPIERTRKKGLLRNLAAARKNARMSP